MREATSEQQADRTAAAALLVEPLHVINVGLDGFADELAAAGIAVTRVEWRPPAGGDAHLAALLAKLGL